jgi:hypothetical protein
VVVSAFVTVTATNFSGRVQDQDKTITLLAGRLATVEPDKRRLTVVVDGEVALSEVLVSDAARIMHDARQITLSDLVILVGRKVEVAYRLQDDRRIADHVIVAPD